MVNFSDVREHTPEVRTPAVLNGTEQRLSDELS